VICNIIINFPYRLSKSTVEVVFDVVVASTRDVFGYFGPSVAVLCLQLEEQGFFLSGPLYLAVDIGVQLVKPPSLL
jgi:hypothetical protein